MEGGDKMSCQIIHDVRKDQNDKANKEDNYIQNGFSKLNRKADPGENHDNCLNNY